MQRDGAEERERERERERHLCPEWHRPIDFPLLASRRVPCVASVVLHLNMAEPCLSLSLLRCACHPSKGEMQEEIERERERVVDAGWKVEGLARSKGRCNDEYDIS